MAYAAGELGVVGLGRMGGGLALQAREVGLRVVGLDAHGLRAELLAAGVEEARTLDALVAALAPPRAVFLYVPAGPPVDALLDALAPLLARGDVVVDGGNSYWGDSIRRHDRLAGQGIELVDLGTSGGVEGARRGACFMAGGEAAAVARVEPLLRALAVEDGYVHAGPPGAGHFVKLVHNGIEFGMLQAIGEGVDLLERYHDRLDVAAVLSAWRHGSVIRGWLMDLMHAGYESEGGLDAVPPYVEDTGEVSWLVADALRLEAPIPVIAQAVLQLFASRDGEKRWARAVAMMRHGFGGHPYGPSAPVAEERRTGQVGGTWRDEHDRPR
ncbi:MULTISPECIES: NADP-dependent phosphogluconate dehydrogenase [unclassified Anaeromyxobacter]|uniref:NADP-dependent phosphogluconate dehydrogenase n=1 Tax=unclassified Anaeromyxobacter TaxID=2620896 RepID=UPI001F59168F|nr:MULTISPECIES: NADP-dependent phosphogluconate dehydrogenase [unclassified Anaeromyxobacter]